MGSHGFSQRSDSSLKKSILLPASSAHISNSGFVDKLQKEVCQGEREVQLLYHAGAPGGEARYGGGQEAEWREFPCPHSQGPLGPVDAKVVRPELVPGSSHPNFYIW